ncbi:uncharacterized protein EV422DRAFT_306804 [Fimicolochytrium jonesii]|uniref:uncharacterized protein n=1 Tax=Fimicolochytrium jonesii TaxID=1396493 RepID=UPI0022FF2350|nr:uncharacterized protein EV422DRAFT_306804 [Fimicolochytrium jonesii]KAI8824105.1 hypothetical protein EV422DRAFT_306804 [Fimicolochytrium jonesii]
MSGPYGSHQHAQPPHGGGPYDAYGYDDSRRHDDRAPPAHYGNDYGQSYYEPEESYYNPQPQPTFSHPASAGGPDPYHAQNNYSYDAPQSAHTHNVYAAQPQRECAQYPQQQEMSAYPPSEYSGYPQNNDLYHPQTPSTPMSYAVPHTPTKDAYRYPSPRSEFSHGSTKYSQASTKYSQASRTPLDPSGAAKPAAHTLATKSSAGAFKAGFNDDDNKNNNKRIGTPRYCCGCFGTRRCCLTFVTILFLLLAGGGVAAWYYWPKVPNIATSSPYIPVTAAGFKLPPTTAGAASAFKWSPGPRITGSLTDASTAAPFELDLGLGVNVTVDSPNNVGFTINTLKVDGTLLNLMDPQKKPLTPMPGGTLIASSQIVDIHIDKRANTTIMLPILISYQRSLPFDPQILALKLIPCLLAQKINPGAGCADPGDPVLAAFIMACGIPGILEKQPGSKLTMTLKIELDLKIIAWTGFKPSSIREQSFDCPSTLTDLFKSVFGGMMLPGPAAIPAVIPALGT